MVTRCIFHYNNITIITLTALAKTILFTIFTIKKDKSGADLGEGWNSTYPPPPCFCWTPELVDWAIWTILCFGRFYVLAIV